MVAASSSYLYLLSANPASLIMFQTAILCKKSTTFILLAHMQHGLKHAQLFRRKKNLIYPNFLFQDAE